MATAQSVIKKFMSTLNKTKKTGQAALSEAIASVSKFKSYSQLVETMISDLKASPSTFLKKRCGIILNNSDTGAIIGKDAGGSTTKTASSIVPESGSWKYPSSTSFTIQGLTVTVPKKNTLSQPEQIIVGGLYSWWIKSSLDLINKSFGLSFKDKGASTKKISVSFYNRNDGQVAAVSYGSGQKNTSLKLKINSYYFKNISKTNKNGNGSSQLLTYLDRTIVHELVHAVMAANVDYFSKLPTSFKEGSAELVHGIDDKRLTNIQNVTKTPSALKSALSGSSTNSYAAGYILLRYLAKQAAAGRKPVTSKKSSTSALLTSSNSPDFLDSARISDILPEKNLSLSDFSSSSAQQSLFNLTSSSSLPKVNNSSKNA